jgi:hypothetical protein
VGDGDSQQVEQAGEGGSSMGDAEQRAPAEYESAMAASRFPMKNIKGAADR